MDYLALANRAIQEGTTFFEFQKGDYFIWRSDCGAQLWGQLADGRKRLLGMSPHFYGPGRVRIRVTSFVEDPEGTPLDGQVDVVLLVGSENDPEPQELCPFAFDAPNFLRACQLEPQLYREAQLAGFAREFHAYRTEEEFRSSRHGKYAAKAFFPMGAFDESRKTQALLTGCVVETAVKTNPISGNAFHWALVRTIGGTVDVVASLEMLNDRLEPGNIVVVGCRLSGLLVAPFDF